MTAGTPHGAGAGLSVNAHGNGAIEARVAAKLRGPTLSAFDLSRHAVCDRVLSARNARLVLLHAPAGFGKTTVMAQLRKRLVDDGVVTAWLTLDAADNDIERFLAGLAGVVDALTPHRANAPDQLHRVEDQHGYALGLIDRIAAHQGPLTLFFDDMESVVHPATLGLIGELVAQMPQQATLVVGSRGIPNLNFGRLRARGQLLEVEATELRLSVEETAELLSRRHRGLLSNDDVARLHRSTEGWAAAVWLASLSLGRRDDPAAFIAGFSGSNTTIVAYLLEDVLAGQPDDVRSFLLRTSILKELNASICDALCGRGDSAEMLRYLERTHLFLVPLQGEGEIYRYHSMFAEFLRVLLRQQHAEDMSRLHRRAASWYFDRGRPVPAIDHALQSGDASLFLPWLKTHAPTLLEQGRVRLLTRWLQPLVVRNELAAAPMLRVIHAWAVSFARGPRAAWKHLIELEELEECDSNVAAHRSMLRPFLLAMMDRISEAAPLGARVLEQVPSRRTFARDMLEIAVANMLIYGGRYQQAQQLVDTARSRQGARRSGLSFVLAEAAEGAIDLTQGRLRQALGRLKLAVNAGVRDRSRDTNGNTMVATLWAEALYEAGRCEHARRLLSVNVPLIRHVGVPRQLITAHVILARILEGERDRERAFELLTELEHTGYRERMPRAVAGARLERVRLLAIDGRVADAKTELERCREQLAMKDDIGTTMGISDVETLDVATARWELAARRGAESVAPLRASLRKAQNAGQERRGLTLRLLLAQALHQAGEDNKAQRMLAGAVGFAAAEGYVRAFLDEGPLLMSMLRDLNRVPALLEADVHEGGAQHPVAFLAALLGDDDVISQPALRQPGPQCGREGLTGKEIQVLQLVAEGLSNAQVARHLSIAETTVRTHLRKVNAKLDVRNRMEAVQMSRRLGLIT